MKHSTCHCGSRFEFEKIPPFPDPTECDECDSKARKAEAEALKTENNRRAEFEKGTILKNFDRLTPSEFQPENNDLTREDFNHEVWGAIRNWRPTRDHPWLGLVGSKSGGCKTRCGYMLMRDIVAESVKAKANGDVTFLEFSAIASYDLKLSALQQYGSEDDTHRDVLNRLSSVGILLLDDIGKARHTPAVAEEMFTVIDKRYVHGLPMIWTSNSHPKSFASDIKDKELAGPLSGRILEKSLIIDLD